MPITLAIEDGTGHTVWIDNVGGGSDGEASRIINVLHLRTRIQPQAILLSALTTYAALLDFWMRNPQQP